MTSAKSIELTIRVAKMIKLLSELIGRNDVPLSRMVVKELQEDIKAFDKFLNTAENDK